MEVDGRARSSLADHDMSILARIMFESSAANIFDWYDKFVDDCLEGRSLNRVRKKTGSSGSAVPDTGLTVDLEILPCRFIRLFDPESAGLLRVHKGGTEVSRVAYLWMGTTSF